MTCDLATGPSIPPTHLPHLTKGSPAQCSSCRMITDRTVTTRNEATVRKAAEADLEVGSICADRDGNRIRIDRVDRAADTLSYHFLNDELRVQEGIQERSIRQFLAEGWYIAAPGTSDRKSTRLNSSHLGISY